MCRREREGHRSIERGVRSSPSVEAALTVTVVLAARTIAKGGQRVTDDALTLLARSTLAMVFLYEAKPTMRHEPMPVTVTKARNTSLVNLASLSITSTMEDSEQDHRHISRIRHRLRRAREAR